MEVKKHPSLDPVEVVGKVTESITRLEEQAKEDQITNLEKRIAALEEDRELKKQVYKRQLEVLDDLALLIQREKAK